MQLSHSWDSYPFEGGIQAAGRFVRERAYVHENSYSWLHDVDGEIVIRLACRGTIKLLAGTLCTTGCFIACRILAPSCFRDDHRDIRLYPHCEYYYVRSKSCFFWKNYSLISLLISVRILKSVWNWSSFQFSRFTKRDKELEIRTVFWYFEFDCKTFSKEFTNERCGNWTSHDAARDMRIIIARQRTIKLLSSNDNEGRPRWLSL